MCMRACVCACMHARVQDQFSQSQQIYVIDNMGSATVSYETKMAGRKQSAVIKCLTNQKAYQLKTMLA